MAYNINNQSFELQECCGCGVNFLLPVVLGNSLRQNKKSFYCPNGHGQSYTQSDADKLKSALEQKQLELNSAYNKIRLLENPPKRKAKRIKKI